jgi:helix-turn-helix protein
VEEHRERFGSSQSAGLWACRRPHATSAPPASVLGRVIGDERLLALIREIHEANYCAYGYRRTWKALLRAGEAVGRDRVRRLMTRLVFRAPSGEANHGEPHEPIPGRRAAQTWRSAISLLAGRG